MQYAYSYAPQQWPHPCHQQSIVMVQHTPHPCVYPPGAMIQQQTSHHHLCTELEQMLCMILARAPYHEGCCRNAVELCKAYEARLKACCAGRYGGGGVEPGCARGNESNSQDMEGQYSSTIMGEPEWITEEMTILKRDCPANEVRYILGNLFENGKDAKNECETKINYWIKLGSLPSDFKTKKLLKDLLGLVDKHKNDVQWVNDMVLWFTGKALW